MQIRQETIDFLTLKMTHAEYCKAYTADPTILEQLYSLYPETRDISAPEWKKISWKLNLEYMDFDLAKLYASYGTTPFGKSTFYSLVYDIASDYLDFPKSRYYGDAWMFMEYALPSYVGGMEVDPLIDSIYHTIPDDISDTQKRKLFKEEIKKHFLCKTKKHPYWPQSPNWPATKSGEPMIYVSQKKKGDLYMLLFEDPETGETRTVEEYM